MFIMTTFDDHRLRNLLLACLLFITLAAGVAGAAEPATKPAAKATSAKKKTEELARQKRLKKLEQLTLKIFRWAYESNQRGEFQRL